MPSTYTSNLGIELPADGELDGVWGDVVNDNMSIIDRATNGSVTLTLSGTSSTLTTSDGTLSDGQYKLLVLGGSPSGTHTITIAPSDAQKIYFVRNTTAQSVVFTQGSGGNVTVATGDSAIIYSDGAGAGAAVVNVSNDFSMSSVKITGGTIDGTTIGGTTPAAGSFTTLSASGDLTIADKIVHDGDTNTSIRFPAADTVTVETSGAERMRITSTGNVGIGTSSPGTYALAVLGSQFTNMLVESTQTGSYLQLKSSVGSAFISTPGADILAFHTSSAATERMRIDSSGNVGIGTSSPSSRLEVFATAAASIPAAGAASSHAEIGVGAYGTLIGSLSSGLGYIQQQRTDGTATTYNLALQPNGGKVGIGTSSPAFALDVNGGTDNVVSILRSTDNLALQSFRDDTTGSDGFVMIGANGTSMVAYTQGSERMRIDSSGNVGIGTNSPAVRGHFVANSGEGDPAALTSEVLRIQRNLGSATTAAVTIIAGSAATGGYYFGDSASASIGGVVYDNSVDAMTLRVNNTERMRIDSSGNVGIGTSVPSDYNAAADNLVVGTTVGANGITIASGSTSQGSLFFADGTATASEEAAGYIAYVHSTDFMSFGTNATERMRIDSSGNVLVGLTTAVTGSTAGSVSIRSNGINMFVGGGVIARESQAGLVLSGSDIVPYFNGATSDNGVDLGASALRFRDLNLAGALRSDVFTVTNIAGTERMRIDSSGNVGIGTTSPQARLSVSDASAIGFEVAPNFSGGIVRQIAYNRSTSAFVPMRTQASQHEFYSASGEVVRIDSSGNVGIGTSSPTANLQVGANPGSDRTFQMGSAGATRFVISTDGANGLTNIGCTNDSTTGRLAFRTGSALTERMRIDQSGNVGIGTAAPAARLDVTGASINALQARFGNLANRGLEISTALVSSRNDAGSVLNARADGQAGTLIFQREGTESMRIDSSGNVGIGTSSPAQRLDVRSAAANDVQARFGFTSGRGLEISTALVSGTNDAGSVLNALGATAGTMIFQTDSTERMRITSAGNVGIGTSSPAAKLEVRNDSAGASVEVARLANNGAGANTKARLNFFAASTNYGAITGGFGAATPEMTFDIIGGTHGQFIWTSASTERMRIDSSGNVGIGTATITPLGSNITTVTVNGTSGGGIQFQRTDATAVTGLVAALSGAFALGSITSTDVTFRTNNTERMRIDASGNALFGCTSMPSASVFGTGISRSLLLEGNKSSVNSTSGVTHWTFFNPNGAVGSISTSGTATAYNTSSDYRLKEDVQPMVGASDRVLSLNPVNFAWKADGTRTDGFIAHEVQAVAPQAVTGVKDGEEMQAIDHSKLVPLLTAALQEALTEIAGLKARITALEA